MRTCISSIALRRQRHSCIPLYTHISMRMHVCVLLGCSWILPIYTLPRELLPTASPVACIKALGSLHIYTSQPAMAYTSTGWKVTRYTWAYTHALAREREREGEGKWSIGRATTTTTSPSWSFPTGRLMGFAKSRSCVCQDTRTTWFRVKVRRLYRVSRVLVRARGAERDWCVGKRMHMYMRCIPTRAYI